MGWRMAVRHKQSRVFLSSVSLPAPSKTRRQTGPLASLTTNFDFFVLLDEELGFPENKPI
jgi:hypothetical protein